MTAGQVILRFSQYEGYPARAALMSRAYNSATYYQEVLRFLHVDPKALYSGYCELLRREAWGTAGRSEATLHLLSQLVHEELATIAMAIETSTLDVERNRNLYSAAKLAVVFSVAKASRDGAPPPQLQRASISCAQTSTLTKIHIAYERWPDLFPQARGQLHWGQVR